MRRPEGAEMGRRTALLHYLELCAKQVELSKSNIDDPEIPKIREEKKILEIALGGNPEDLVREATESILP